MSVEEYRAAMLEQASYQSELLYSSALWFVVIAVSVFGYVVFRISRGR